MKEALPLLVAGVICFVLGLVIGLKGCQDQSPTQLLKENAELAAEVDRQRHLAKVASEARAEHAAARNKAERALKASQSRVDAADETIRGLRGMVRQRETLARCTPERELIHALDVARAEDKRRIDLLQQAVDAAKLELEAGHEIEAALNAALVASEKRADKLERAYGKGRRQKIMIGVGAALGGAALSLGAVYAAGQLPR